ncbi:MAG TPA: SAF domain-containing protein [Bacilli bacterium]|nr:SAF domain-containing protein [Bacilli bacterium]
MGNLMVQIKKFLSNKNTVTILGILLGVVVLYVGYSYRIGQSINPVSIPFAKVEITSRTKITAEMIGYTDVPKSLVKKNENIVTNANDLIGKYVNFGCVIAENSFFYSQLVVKQVTLQDNADIPDGFTLYPLKVNLDTTYGNSIFPGENIDLYIKTENELGEVVFGKLIEQIEVKSVKDSKGQYVFETASESRTPSVMNFAVPDCMFNLLKIAEELGYEIIPVPRNAAYTEEEGSTIIASPELQEMIFEKAAPLNISYDMDPCNAIKAE